MSYDIINATSVYANHPPDGFEHHSNMRGAIYLWNAGAIIPIHGYALQAKYFFRDDYTNFVSQFRLSKPYLFGCINWE